LRRAIERLSRGVVLRRRLPAHLGGQVLFVTPDSALKLWLPGLERADPLLLGWASELVETGATVWDVGANVGLFAFAAAFLAGPDGAVTAIEPDDALTRLMRRSARKLPASNAPINILTAAVSDTVRVSDFFIAARGRSANHLQGVDESTQCGGSRSVHKVLTVSLDWLLESLHPPDVVKIDTEGAEAACLAGGAQLLREVRPKLLCEVTEREAPAIAEILHDHRYVMLDAAQPAERREPLSSPAWNTLALPAEALAAERSGTG
jgi:FkbM family methyltransferase